MLCLLDGMLKIGMNLCLKTHNNYLQLFSYFSIVSLPFKIFLFLSLGRQDDNKSWLPAICFLTDNL